jgi:cobalamin biosynthetic protein CobC
VADASGRVREAARDYGAALDDWVDLSTAVNRWPYPVHPIAPASWQRRADDDEALERAAADYYGNANLIALPGAQLAIKALPALFKPLSLACLAPVYEPHALAWESFGHKPRRLPTLARALAATTPNILLSNPNSPDAATTTPDALLAAAEALHRRGGFLVVDETFADAEPDASLAALAGGARAPNLIVLRSLDLFFGLAGARVAFVLAAPEKLDRLRQLVGSDAVAPPSRAAAHQALADIAWQSSTREGLAAASQRLAALLAALGPVSRSTLFCALKLPETEVAALYDHLARRAILTRRCAGQGLLRFGLPRDENEWQRLSAALAEWTQPHA